jgi:anti-sigma factor RsiW
MTDCRRAKEILPLYGGGELDPREMESIRNHLLRCASCSTEMADYERVSTEVRLAFQGGDSLPSGVVARVAEKAASDAVRPPWWRILVPMALPRPALVSAVPMALLVLAVVVPVAVRHRTAPERGSESPASIQIQMESGAVHVSWLDGRDRPYRVYKSTDPRDLGQGRAQMVRGNVWVDKQVDTAPVVFYRID